MALSILGICGTVMGLFRALPQLVRLLQSRKAAGVSVDTAATSSMVSFGWTAYGILTGQPYVTLATGASGLIFFLVTIFALVLGRKIREFRVMPVWAVVLWAAWGIWGAGGLGTVLPVSVLASNLPQVRVAFRETDLKGLSLGTWLLSMTDGLIWGAYAMIQQDISIMVYGAFQILTSSAIIVGKQQSGARRATMTEDDLGRIRPMQR